MPAPTSLTPLEKRDLNEIFIRIAALVGLTPHAEAWTIGDLMDAGLGLAGNLALTTNGKGASLVGIEDAANIIVATNVEGALAEIVTKLSKFPTPGAVGRIIYSDGTNYVELTPGTAGQFLRAAGAAAPSWANILATELPLSVLGAPGSKSGAGAIDITAAKTYLTSTAAGQANTLANGSYTGQIKRIVADASFDGSKSATITPANGPAITFAVAGDWVEYEWGGAAWVISGRYLQPQTGQITLVAGTLTVSSGITIRGASTKVILQMRTPGAGVNGVQYKISSLTAGAPGTGAFTVTAVDATAGGATVNTDISVLDYTIPN